MFTKFTSSSTLLKLRGLARRCLATEAVLAGGSGTIAWLAPPRTLIQKAGVLATIKNVHGNTTFDVMASTNCELLHTSFQVGDSVTANCTIFQVETDLPKENYITDAEKLLEHIRRNNRSVSEKFLQKYLDLQDSNRQSMLASILKRYHYYPEAIALFRRSLEAKPPSASPDDEDKVTAEYELGTANIHNELAESLLAIGETQGALAENEHARAIRQSVGGLDHPELAQTYRNTGLAYHTLGDLPKALEQYQQSLRILKLHLGMDHEETASCLLDIGVVHEQQEHDAKALAILEQATHIYKDLFPDERHIGLANAYSKMLLPLIRLGRKEEAHRLQRTSLEIRKSLQQDPIDVTTAHYQLAANYRKLGNIQEATDNYRFATAMAESVYGEESLVAAYGHSYIGIQLRLQYKDHEAAAEHRRALTVFKKLLPPDHPSIINEYIHIGTSQMPRGDLQWALSSLQKGQSLQEQAHGEKDPSLIDTLFLIAQVHVRLQDYEKALEAYRRCLSIVHSAPDGHAVKKTGRSEANIQEAIAFILGKMGKVEEAYNTLNSMLPKVMSVAGQRSHSVAGWHFSMSSLSVRKGDVKEARTHLEVAEQILVDAVGEKHPDLQAVRTKIQELVPVSE